MRTPKLQKKSAGDGAAWDEVWSSRGLMDMVAVGRAVYNRLFLRELRPYISAETNMVELGCGTASLGRMLAKFVRSYTGIDSSVPQTTKSRKACIRFPNMTIITRDLYDGTLHETYDLVWSQGLLEHFEDPADMVIKHLEYCRAGGSIVISIPRSKGYLEWWHHCSKATFFIPWPWTDQRFFSESDLRLIMEKIPREQYNSFQIKNLHPAFAGIILLIIQAPIR